MLDAREQPPSPGPPTTPPRAPAQYRGASPTAHCSTVTYLLTTHSTEVAVDEAMYLVVTSEAAYITHWTLEVTERRQLCRTIPDAMEEEIDGAG